MLLPDLEIRAKLSRYLSGGLTLDEFEEWFIPETWSIENSGSSRAVALATEVRSALFRVTTGDADEEAFKALARQKVREVVADLEPEQAASDAPEAERVQAPVLTGA